MDGFVDGSMVHQWVVNQDYESFLVGNRNPELNLNKSSINGIYWLLRLFHPLMLTFDKSTSPDI